MLPHGLLQNNTYQDFPGLITFYPRDYFCPKDSVTKKVNKTKNTATIHHIDGSWLPQKKHIQIMKKIFGIKLYNIIIKAYLDVKFFFFPRKNK